MLVPVQIILGVGHRLFVVSRTEQLRDSHRINIAPGMLELTLASVEAIRKSLRLPLAAGLVITHNLTTRNALVHSYPLQISFEVLVV